MLDAGVICTLHTGWNWENQNFGFICFFVKSQQKETKIITIIHKTLAWYLYECITYRNGFFCACIEMGKILSNQKERT